MSLQAEPQARRGVSLVETLVVVGVSGAIAATAVSALTALRQIARRVARTPVQVVDRGRLAETLRRDAHAADSLRWDRAAGTVAFRLPNGRLIRYRQDGGRLRRVVVEGGGAPAQRGVWPLPAGGGLQCRPATAERGALVTLALDSGGWRTDQPPPLRVRALIGRDHALLPVQ